LTIWTPLPESCRNGDRKTWDRLTKAAKRDGSVFLMFTPSGGWQGWTSSVAEGNESCDSESASDIYFLGLAATALSRVGSKPLIPEVRS
jgi:hypothetical protein